MSTAESEWQMAWQPMVAAIGRKFGADFEERWGEVIEAGAVLRYLEPLEFACRLHSDGDVARSHGFDGQTVPYTALASFCLPLTWRPGDAPLYLDAARDAQPARSPVGGIVFGLEPPTTHFFAVDSSADFLKPATVGDRICRRGALLLSCVPRETKVGRGAFIAWQTEVINQRRELLARLRTTFFRYAPHVRGEAVR